MLRLHLVGYPALVADALARLLERHGVEVVGRSAVDEPAGGPRSAVDADVVLLHAGLPQVSHALVRWRQRAADHAVVVVAGRDGVDLGATGQSAAAALRAARARGHRSPAAPVALPAQLTSREVDVLELVARGWRTGAVAERLEISPHTVRTHLQNIYVKLDVPTRFAAVATARERGLLQAAARTA